MLPTIRRPGSCFGVLPVARPVGYGLEPARLMVLIGALGLAAGAQAQSLWAEHVIYSPRTGENVVSLALAPLSAPNTSLAVAPLGTAVVEDFYVVFEVEDPSHKLYLQKWNGTAFWAFPVELDSGPIGILFNPSITTRAGHVTISAHYAASGCIGLKEYDYDTATGTIDHTREIDNGNGIPGGNCEDVGHNHIVWSAADSTYHVCWTRKEGGATGDEVYCSKRVETANSWDAPDNICGSCSHNQDHSTIAINSLGSRRLAYHDQTTNLPINDNEAQEAMLALYKPLGSKVTYLLPQGTSPQPRWQDRPFIALDGDGKMHGAWEDGPNGGEVIKYARCLNSTPNGCDAAAEWEFNNVAISEAGMRARFPHLMIASGRTWISYEQVSNGTNDVVVLYRCLGVPNGDAWTISDPYPADDRDEYTEEYGTPHIAARATGFIGTSQVGTVTLRRIPIPKTIPGPVRYEGVLYTRSDRSCS